MVAPDFQWPPPPVLVILAGVAAFELAPLPLVALGAAAQDDAVLAERLDDHRVAPELFGRLTSVSNQCHSHRVPVSLIQVYPPDQYTALFAPSSGACWRG